MEFDAALTGSADEGLFGLPFTEDKSELVLIPVPWEVTTSYGGGTSAGPEAVLQASPQLDLFDLETGDTYQRGIFLRPIPEEIKQSNEATKPIAQRVIELVTERTSDPADIEKLRGLVNKASQAMVDHVYQSSVDLLNRGKIVGIIGGDHSSPLGLIKALSERHDSFGILHVDAHADLRSSYQGFTYSHASIMDNVMMLEKAPKKLVQVGIRDFCEEEYQKIQNSNGRITAFFDQQVKEEQYAGKTWIDLCRGFISELPENVYVSFDIDGLSPAFCPSTGTPVPGGLDFNQAVSLLHELTRSGRQIIGFDLCEVAPSPDGQDEWDGNVGARLLYKLCCLALHSRRS